jgi:hypothetical protein
MRFKKMFAASLMSMMVSQSVPAMASGFTDFIMKNQAWSYADMRSTSNTNGSVLGITRIDVPYTNCMVLCKYESCVKIIVDGIVEKVIPVKTSIEDGTYTLTDMYPETSISGVLEITDTSGDIKNIGGQEGHVSISGQDSLLLAEMATIGEKVVVRA